MPSTGAQLVTNRMLFKRLRNKLFPPHKADEYFRYKFRERMGREAFNIVSEANSIRHQYPDLSGPELVRLVYWGASGAKEPA